MATLETTKLKMEDREILIEKKNLFLKKHLKMRLFHGFSKLDQLLIDGLEGAPSSIGKL